MSGWAHIFDLTNGLNVLRLICGLFFIPHIVGKFTELAATAIANAESRAELTASRARLVAAGDQARQRIERDLHDGVQQRLVSLALDLTVAGHR